MLLHNELNFDHFCARQVDGLVTSTLFYMEK